MATRSPLIQAAKVLYSWITCLILPTASQPRPSLLFLHLKADSGFEFNCFFQQEPHYAPQKTGSYPISNPQTISFRTYRRLLNLAARFLSGSEDEHTSKNQYSRCCQLMDHQNFNAIWLRHIYTPTLCSVVTCLGHLTIPNFYSVTTAWRSQQSTSHVHENQECQNVMPIPNATRSKQEAYTYPIAGLSAHITS